MVAVMTNRELFLIVKAREFSRSGEAVRIREAAGLSQSEVAAVVDVSAATVSRWEAGERTPRGKPAARWARLLDDLNERQRVREIGREVGMAPIGDLVAEELARLGPPPSAAA